MAGMYRYKVADIKIPLGDRSPLVVDGKVVQQNLSDLVRRWNGYSILHQMSHQRKAVRAQYKRFDVRPSHAQGLGRDKNRQKKNTTEANQRAQ